MKTPTTEVKSYISLLKEISKQQTALYFKGKDGRGNADDYLLKFLYSQTLEAINLEGYTIDSKFKLIELTEPSQDQPQNNAQRVHIKNTKTLFYSCFDKLTSSCVKLMNCGAIDISFYELDFRLPRILLAVLLNFFLWNTRPTHKEDLIEADNLKNFL